MDKVKTAEEVRAWFDRHGTTVSDWARANGFDPAVVLNLLSGRTAGRRGMAYQAAVALGLREAPPDNELPPVPVRHERTGKNAEARMKTG